MKRNLPARQVAEKHLYTQLRNLRNIFDLAVTAVLSEKRSLDRFLSSYWRENRQFGSRDRRLFSESIFAFFRFYGWLQLLLTEEENALLAAGNSRQLSGRSVAMLLAAAWVLENLPPEPAHNLLCREFELPAMPEADWKNIDTEVEHMSDGKNKNEDDYLHNTATEHNTQGIEYGTDNTGCKTECQKS